VPRSENTAAVLGECGVCHSVCVWRE